MRTSVWFPLAASVIEPESGISVFLGGTIDNGNSFDWQAVVTQALQGVVGHIFNPRRPDWDASWVQREDNPQFNAQVNWELDHIEKADLVVMYLAPGSLSPISLLEIGLTAAKSPEKLLVCCPEDFWRKGNVDIVCTREGVRRFETMEELICAVEDAARALALANCQEWVR